jgi:hypothetical protein
MQSCLLEAKLFRSLLQLQSIWRDGKKLAEVTKLGNLTLLEGPINGSLNFTNDLSTDEWFEKKKTEYQKSKNILTLSLLNNEIGKNTAYNKFVRENLIPFSSWGPEEITRRQEMIQKLAEKIWTIKN